MIVEVDWGWETTQSPSPSLHPPLHVLNAQQDTPLSPNKQDSSTHARQGNGNRDSSGCQIQEGQAGRISRTRRTTRHWDQKKQAKRVVDVAQPMDAQLQFACQGKSIPSLPDRMSDEWIAVGSVLKRQG